MRLHIAPPSGAARHYHFSTTFLNAAQGHCHSWLHHPRDRQGISLRPPNNRWVIGRESVKRPPFTVRDETAILSGCICIYSGNKTTQKENSRPLYWPVSTTHYMLCGHVKKYSFVDRSLLYINWHLRRIWISCVQLLACSDNWIFPLIVTGVGKSVHLCHVQLQREEGRACRTPSAGWLHGGLYWPPAR